MSTQRPNLPLKPIFIKCPRFSVDDLTEEDKAFVNTPMTDEEVERVFGVNDPSGLKTYLDALLECDERDEE